MTVQAYHGVTGAVHQANFNKCSSEGYRIISLSVYSDPGDPRYAAVWVQRQGAAWVAVHGVDSAAFLYQIDRGRLRPGSGFGHWLGW